MLSFLKVPTFIMLIFLIAGFSIAIDLNALRNDVKNKYYNQTTIDNTATKDPNYDPNKTWETAQDPSAQSKFPNYGATITGSCTAVVKETTNELICTERSEDITKVTNHNQTKSLIDITIHQKYFDSLFHNL